MKRAFEKRSNVWGGRKRSGEKKLEADNRGSGRGGEKDKIEKQNWEKNESVGLEKWGVKIVKTQKTHDCRGKKNHQASGEFARCAHQQSRGKSVTIEKRFVRYAGGIWLGRRGNDHKFKKGRRK